MSPDTHSGAETDQDYKHPSEPTVERSLNERLAKALDTLDGGGDGEYTHTFVIDTMPEFAAAIVAALPAVGLALVEVGSEPLHERELGKLIDERDALMEWADKLAYAIAPVEVIGEHSNWNNPWQNAIDHLDERVGSEPLTDNGAEALAGDHGLFLADGGTETRCPIDGVHEHVFRGPHRFREWEPGT